MRFLIVDDSITMRKVVGLALKTGNYEYLEAENGEDALKVIQANPIDFFLVDVNMPGMNGIELVKEIRKNNSHKDTPIIILTTENEAGLKLQGRKAGANEWIEKPFQKEELLKLINKLA
jgi:two-component system chemotaxis response regulator CheY